MATASRAKQSSRTAPPPPAPRRRRRWLFVTTVLLGIPAVLWFAPAIVALPPVLNRVVAQVARDFHGQVTVGSASLGWFSPIVVRDVRVAAADGKQIAAVPVISSSKTLWELIANSRDLGTFTVDHPELDLTLNEQGSNVEQAADDLLKSAEPAERPAAKRLGLALVVTDGQVKIVDTAGGREWQIDELQCQLAAPANNDQPLSVVASGRITPGEQPGRFSLQLTAQPGVADDNTPPDVIPFHTGQGELTLTAESLPLALFEPVLRRIDPTCELEGFLNSNIRSQWNLTSAATPHVELNGEVGVAQLALVGPWTGEDRVRFDSIQIPCTLVRDAERLDVRRCVLQSDVGQLICTGTIADLNQLDANWWKSLWNALPHTQGEVQGTLDLAKLSRILPATMRVREGMSIEEGSVNVDLRSGLTDGHWACAGRVETTRLLAIEQGRQISWDHPLLVTLAGHDTPQGPVVEQLKGESDFLKFEGSGTPAFFGLTANFELSRLLDELGQFVDLGELRIAGDGWSRVTWKRAADDSFEGNAELQATNFVLARPGKPAWSDPRLNVNAALRGQLTGRELTRVDAATVQVAAATDELTAALTAPVATPSDQTVWPIETQLRGDLQRWLARVEPWFSPPAGWDIRGQADIMSTVQLSAAKIAVDQCQADFTQLHAWGPGLYLDEPRLRVAGTGEVARVSETLLVKDATLTTGDVSGRVQDATFSARSDTGLEYLGQGEIQGNLATLYRWLQDPRQPQNAQISGLLAGTLHADFKDRSPALDLSCTVDNLAVVPQNGNAWREQQMRMQVQAVYDEAQDLVNLARCDVESAAVQLAAKGKIDRWSKDRIVALQGQTTYDLEKLTLLLHPLLGSDIRATGRETRTFALSGPIATALSATAPVAARDQAAQQLLGSADFGWQSASVFGFDVGPGNLQTSLNKGLLQFTAARLPVSGGTLTLAPTVQLSPGPAMIYLPAGPLVENVQATPEMCRQWMMYVAPVLAGVTRIDGSFSTQLTGCQLPLANPRAGDVAGLVNIHSINLEPGPVVQELAAVLGRTGTVQLARDSKVDFRMTQGRVYHRGVELQFPEVKVQTYGSVGLDQTLAIMAEMKVPPKWVRDNALGAMIKDQVIRIPIAGTLQRPQLDHKVLDDTLAKFVREAAGGALKSGLQKQLDRFLTPP